MSPEFLKTYRPGEIIIMNRIYRGEIQKMRDEMGVKSNLSVALASC